MTSADVLWSMETITSEASNANRKPQFTRLFFNEKGGSTIIDDYALEVNTGVFQFDMLVWAAAPSGGWVNSKKQAEQMGGVEASESMGAGTGPWEIEDHSTGEFWLFKAVKDHYRKTPNFAEMKFHEIPEESTRLANFQTGKLDTYLGMSLDSRDKLSAIAGTEFLRIPNAASEALHFMGQWYIQCPDPARAYAACGTSKPWISSDPDVTSAEWEKARKVREALYIAVDRQLLVDNLLAGEGAVLGLWGWEAQLDRLPADIREWKFNPARAKQLLADAGYPNGFDITLVPSIRNVPGEVDACEAIGTMWADIGINATLQKIPFSSFVVTRRAHEYIDANCHGTGGRTNP